VQTTIEISDELSMKAEEAAASSGETLQEFVIGALTARLASVTHPASQLSGWRSVFGLADPKMVQGIDTLIAEEFEQVNPSEWLPSPRRGRRRNT
jgi:hypothetical protein